MKKKRKKKSGNDLTAIKLTIIAAILNLIAALINLIEKLL